MNKSALRQWFSETTTKRTRGNGFVRHRGWAACLVLAVTVALCVLFLGGKASMQRRSVRQQSQAAPSAPNVQFCSPSLITIPVGGIIGTATSYPSNINVSGLVGTTSNVTVTINNLQHFWASDLDILLVAPDGRRFIVMSDAGGDAGFDNPATITLADAATVSLPSTGAIPSGSYKPTDNDAGDGFPSPAPAGPYGEPAPAGTATFASVFNGGNPNGTWSLYVLDDSSGAGGSIASGWCLDIATDAPLPGQLQFSSATFNQYAGNTASVTVTRINGTVGPVTVDYAVTNNTATGGTACGAGIDFVTTSGTLSFASGEASKTFNVQLCPDSAPEQGETVNLVLSNPTGGAIIGPQGLSTLVIVPSSNAPATQFCRANPIVISASSDAGAAAPYPSSIPVSGLNGLISNVKITLNGFRHTFGEDVDILLVSPAGQKFVVLSDVGGSQGFTVASNVTLTDFASAELPSSPAPIPTNAYRPTNVGAGNDFFPSPAPAPPYNSPVPGGAATFASTFNGFDPNGNWSLYVYDDLSGGSGVIGGGWCIDISTTAPQGPGQFGFALPQYAVNEGETANVTVARNNGGTGAVTVDYATTSGSATGGASCAPGVDFINRSGTLNFPDGVFTQTIPVQMCLDSDNDPEETFGVALSNATGGATIGANSTSVKITNVDPSIIALDAARHYDREGRTVTIEVFRAFNQIGTASVDYATSSGTATGGTSCAPGIDFVNTSGTLVFPPGTFNRSFTIETCTDTAFEEMETANITLSNIVGAQLNVPSTATLHIFEAVWQKQATFPTGQTLEDVQMISANEGWAVGGYGVILHTTDGGVTWERQASGTYQPLNTVYFKDALHGWASGNIDLYTDDGGHTWRQGFRTGNGAGGSVYGLTFADLNRGFATSNSNSTINRSTDGGRTWFAQDVPFPIGLIKFFDQLNGIASSGQGVLVTSDGGQTWTVRPNATGAGEWFDTNRGWRINNTDVVNGLIRQKIDYTTDGGVTWTHGATPDGTFVFKLYFLDAMNGWGVGTKENIIRTTDGGVTWQTLRGGLNAALRFSYPLLDIHMADTQHGVAVGNTGLLFITADGGATWAPRQTGGGYPVYKMVATDARYAWAGSYNGDLLYTTDGGRFWNRQRIAVGSSPQNALISGLAFPDRQRGWAGLRGGPAPENSGTTILSTTNGGRDWHDTTAPPHVCYALDTFDGQTIVSVGFDGAGAPIVRSTDGGQTWTLMHFPLSEVIRDVDMVSPNVGYAAAGAQIIKSTDGFATWTRVQIGGNWFDVSFVDANNGWALGDSPNNTGVELWHTSNGGQTWDSKPMPDAVAVYAVNAQTAWVVEHDYDPNPLSNATFAIRTTDGGQTFPLRELVSLNSTSTAITFVDPDNGWIGGVNQEFPNLSSDGADVFRRGTLGLSGSTPFDFDGDRISDISVFRPSNATWYLNRTGQGFTYTQFGLASDKIAPADYDGDRKTDLAVFRDGNWYILQSSNNQLRGVQFGQSGDVPVPADYDGDGKSDVAVFRQGAWYILESSTNAFRGVQFGQSGDRVVPADYDGDGKADLAVFRDGTWYLLKSQAGFAAVPFGLSTDVPVAGDYDNDGRADVAVFRGGNWYILQSSTNAFRGVQFGQSGDVPVPADYDGDGQTDQAVYRVGAWHLLRSTDGVTSVSFGLSSDVPAPSASVP